METRSAAQSFRKSILWLFMEKKLIKDNFLGMLHFTCRKLVLWSTFVVDLWCQWTLSCQLVKLLLPFWSLTLKIPKFQRIAWRTRRRNDQSTATTFWFTWAKVACRNGRDQNKTQKSVKLSSTLNTILKDSTATLQCWSSKKVWQDQTLFDQFACGTLIQTWSWLWTSWDQFQDGLLIEISYDNSSRPFF